MRRITKAEAIERLPGVGCAMCALAAGNGGDGVTLVENETAVAVLDRFAARPGHALVILKRHEERLTALDWREYSDLQRMAFEVARGVERVMGARRMWIAALGAAEALVTSFPHLHLHVLPIVETGESSRPARVLSWSEGVWVYDDGEAESLAARVREAMAQSG